MLQKLRHNQALYWTFCSQRGYTNFSGRASAGILRKMSDLLKGKLSDIFLEENVGPFLKVKCRAFFWSKMSDTFLWRNLFAPPSLNSCGTKSLVKLGSGRANFKNTLEERPSEKSCSTLKNQLFKKN